MTSSADRQAIELALSYPFHLPHAPYLLLPGGKISTDPAASPADYEGRFPVLAIGSNRSPKQLLRKFLNLADPLPVEHGRLDDHDIVFSAHLTSYGSVPATLVCQKGCRVQVSITWLNQAQLDRMHETESVGKNYDFGRLKGASIMLDRGETLSEVFVYFGRRGLLAREGNPIPLAAISAEGRLTRAASQKEALQLVRDRVAPGLTIDQFVLGTVNDSALREKRNNLLGGSALPSRHPDFEIAPFFSVRRKAPANQNGGWT